MELLDLYPKKKPELIKNFIGDLHHRGPDNIGIKIIKINDNYLHLGSSRLAIRGNEKEKHAYVVN